jgi:hypothetical protein
MDRWWMGVERPLFLIILLVDKGQYFGTLFNPNDYCRGVVLSLPAATPTNFPPRLTTLYSIVLYSQDVREIVMIKSRGAFNQVATLRQTSWTTLVNFPF